MKPTFRLEDDQSFKLLEIGDLCDAPWIEGGKIVRPVKNMRYNDSPLTLLTEAAAMGAAVRAGGTFDRTDVVPPMIVDGFHFDSTSDAV